jgi:lipopolysaccharide/colanic/teichoic acid biosynthesis glycosyltransferase
MLPDDASRAFDSAFGNGVDPSPSSGERARRADHGMDKPRVRPLVGRIRFQLLGGAMAAMLMPLGIRIVSPATFVLERSVTGTLVGILIAVVIGYYALRQLAVFPSINSAAYVVPVFSIAFLIVITVFFFLRLDYGRIQFFVGYLVALGWFQAVLMRAARLSSVRIGLLPVGSTWRLRDMPGIEWVELTSPLAPRPTLDAIVADLRADHPPEWQRFIADSVLAGRQVFHVKQVIEDLTGRVEIEHLSENTLGSLNPNDAYLKVKQVLDVLAAAGVLLVSFPVLLLVGLLVRLDSPGPALFRQQRVGYRGRVFTVYKFRTMRWQENEKASREKAITRDGDDRITRLGKFLRRSRVDELPQVINILRGEMSWIGPRPEAVPLSQWYTDELPFYRYRHIVRPGITGWAQVNKGHVADIHNVLEKLHYDFYYIKNFSPWLDILITLKTIRTMITGFGAK